MMRNNLPAAAAAMLLLLFSVLLVSPGCKGCRDSSQGVQRVGLVYTAPHELINQVVRGFRDGLAEELPSASYEIIEHHASGDRMQFSATVDAVLAQRPALIAPITTPISQIALQNKPSDVPMVFLAVTDPVGAGLVDSLERPVRATGVSDLAPFEAILQFVRETRPSLHRIGLPYSPEEQPAVYGRDQIVRLAHRFNITVDARPVTNQDELAPLLRTLAEANDALLIGSDNGMFETAPLIVRTATDANKPVFAGDSTSIRTGAVGGYTVDYYQVGREGARIAARVLRGEAPGSIPVLVMNEGVLELNQASARRLGMAFSDAIVGRARVVHNQ